MLESKAYKEYYTFASGVEPLKAKTNYKKKADEPVTSPKTKTAFASKGSRLNSQAKVTKLEIKKQPAKKTKSKGLAVLSEVALSEAEQIKLATKKSKQVFDISHASGSDEGTGTLLGVLDVPSYESKNDKESWGDSEEEGDNDDDGDIDDDGDNAGDNDHDDDSNDERIEINSDENRDLNLDQTDYKNRMWMKELILLLILNFLMKKSLMKKKQLMMKKIMSTKADEHVQGSSVSSDFTSKLLNLENPSLSDTEIASIMETSVPHATIPLPPPLFFNPLPQQKTPTSTNLTITLSKIPNFAFVFKFDQRVSALESKTELKQTNQFAKVVSSILGIVDKYLSSKMKEAVNVAVQLQTNKLREEAQVENQYFLNQANKSIDRSGIQRNLYNALIESYNSEKDIITSYGDVVLLKIGRDDKDKDQDPSAGSDRFVQAEDPSYTVEDSGKHQDQEFVTRDIDEQPADKEATKANRFKKPERPPTPDPDWNSKSDSRNSGWTGFQPAQRHFNEEKAATYELKWIEDLVPILWSSVVDVYSRRRIIAATKLTIKKKYDYCHLEEIQVRRDDQQLYTFKEGDFTRLRLQDIKDMFLLLVQRKLAKLTIDECQNRRELPKDIPLDSVEVLREGHMERQCPTPKRKRDATWFKEKVLLVEAHGNGKVLIEEKLEFLADLGIADGLVKQSVITHNATYQADDLDAYDSDYDEISTAKAVLMANCLVTDQMFSSRDLKLEEKSRCKMLIKQSDPMVLEKKVNTKPINYAELNRLSEDFGKRFVPQLELSDEQALHPIIDQSAFLPVKTEAPRELPKPNSDPSRCCLSSHLNTSTVTTPSSQSISPPPIHQIHRHHSHHITIVTTFVSTTPSPPPADLHLRHHRIHLQTTTTTSPERERNVFGINRLGCCVGLEAAGS
nr:hypothetical protein [Tanacetum cinerariifolium]